MDKLDQMIIAALTILDRHKDVADFRREITFPDRTEYGYVRAHTADGAFVIRIYEHGYMIVPPGVTTDTVQYLTTLNDLNDAITAYFKPVTDE